MAEKQTIDLSAPSTRERRRRQREFLLAGSAFLLIGILTWVELSVLGMDSYLFLALLNLNFILFLAVLLVVARNAVKLILERRRRVLGSKLRTKLVLAFLSLSLAPTALMFLVSMNFVRTSLDYWFQTQVESAMGQALAVAQTAYAAAEERLERRADYLSAEAAERGALLGAPSGEALLAEKFAEYGLACLGVVSVNESGDHVLAWLGDETSATARADLAARLNLMGLAMDLERRAAETSQEPTPRLGFTALPRQGPAGNLVFGIALLPPEITEPIPGAYALLLLAEPMGPGLGNILDEIVGGVEEYRQMRALKDPLTQAIYFILGVITLIILLGAMWFGFRLAKEISRPIMALVEGTQRIARGDLSVRLADDSGDEIGMLVDSFNRMAEDLETSRAELEAANAELAGRMDELAERGRYIEAVLDNIAAGVVSLNADGAVSTVNKAASAMLGIDAKQYVGARPAELLRGEHRDLMTQILAQTRGQDKTRGRDKRKRELAGWSKQVHLSIDNAERSFLVNAVSLATPGTQDQTTGGWVAVFEDITELEKIQRMEAWREVAKRIAHEIKNPLTPIKLSAQRLERKFAEDVADPTFGQLTTLIVRQVEHLQQMVAEFSAFAKLPEVTPVPGDLTALVRESVDLYRHGHAEIDWSFEPQGEIPRVRMDEEAMRRVLLNILANAVEAIESTARESRTATPQHIETRLAYDPNVDLVRLTVADTGPGLTEEERSHLFEPYFSRKKGGTGLGLTIVRSIVSDHHGYVRARTRETGGTEISIELPVA